MQSPTFDKFASNPRKWVLWTVVGVVVTALLTSFYMLCSQQVQKAQQRDAALRSQRVAIADCLQHVPRSTLNTCSTQVAPVQHDVLAQGGMVLAGGDKGANRMAMTLLPVGFSYR